MRRVPAALLVLVVATVAGAGELAAASLPPCCSAGSPCAPAAVPVSVAAETRVVRVERRSSAQAMPIPGRCSKATLLSECSGCAVERRSDVGPPAVRPSPLRL